MLGDAARLGLVAAFPQRTALLDDLGGLEQHVRGDHEAERLGRLEVDDEVELAGLFHGQFPKRRRSAPSHVGWSAGAAIPWSTAGLNDYPEAVPVTLPWVTRLILWRLTTSVPCPSERLSPRGHI